MRAMKTSLITLSVFIFCLFTMQACSFEDGFDHVDADFSSHSDVLTRSDCSEKNLYASSILKDKIITEEFVPVILSDFIDKSLFKDVDRYSIQKVTKGNKNLMYVVNFDKGGWVIISGRFNVDNIILASGSEGRFDPNQIDCPEVRFWLEMTEEMVNNELEEDEVLDDEENVRSGPYDNEPYVWVRIPIGYVNSSSLLSSVDPLTITKWSQGWPWNYKTPFVNGYKTPLGCFPVAAAQLIVYLHNTIGHPAGRYRQIDTSFTWNGYDGYVSHVTRSDYSNNWYVMALENPGFQSALTDHVGDLIIDVGDRFQATYSYPYTSTSVYSYSNFSYFGLSCSLKDYDSYYDVDEVISNLEGDLPVIMNGWKSNVSVNINKIGHAWLIDGYKKYHNISDYQQYLRIIPTDSLSWYTNLGYDAIYTDSEKESLYPGIEEYEIIHNETHYYPVQFHMNWGHGGLYNDYYSITPATWITDSPNAYQYGLKIMYDFVSIE